MKKNGFTLIELLAVIVILALLSSIAVPSAMSISSKVKMNMYCEKASLILTNAQTWGNDNKNRLGEDANNDGVSDCYQEVSVSFLISKGYLKKDQDKSCCRIKNPITDSPMDADTVGIYRKNNQAYVFFINKEENASTITDNNSCASTTPICINGVSTTSCNTTEIVTTKCAKQIVTDTGSCIVGTNYCNQ